MWYFALWLVRSSIMSDLKPTPVAPTTLPPVRYVEPIDPRTLADVEADMTRVARELIAHRTRKGDTANRIEIRDGLPALPTQELKWLEDEWDALNARG